MRQHFATQSGRLLRLLLLRVSAMPADAACLIGSEPLQREYALRASGARNHRAPTRYIASGVGLSAGGSMPKLLAVMQVMEKLPIAPTNATRAASPMVFSAAA